MALKFQEIFIKGLFFSVLLVKSSSRIMVEIDMKKNDAAPFPPSKLLLKNDEFNVKYAPGFSYLPTALSRTAWFVIPHQTLTTCLFSKDVRRIDKSQPTRRQQSKEPTTDFVLSRHHLWTELWVVLSYWGEVWIYIYFSKLKKEKCTYLSRILSRINFHNKVMFCM